MVFESKCGKLEMVMKEGQASFMVLQGVDWISSSRNIRRQVGTYISVDGGFSISNAAHHVSYCPTHALAHSFNSIVARHLFVYSSHRLFINSSNHPITHWNASIAGLTPAPSLLQRSSSDHSQSLVVVCTCSSFCTRR